MPYRDPRNWELGTWLIGIIMACSGGVVNWYSKVKAGYAKPFNIVELIGEIFTSGFVGMGVFMAMDAWDQPIGLAAAAAGVAGHMATRFLFAVESVLESHIKKFEDPRGKTSDDDRVSPK